MWGVHVSRVMQVHMCWKRYTYFRRARSSQVGFYLSYTLIPNPNTPSIHTHTHNTTESQLLLAMNMQHQRTPQMHIPTPFHAHHISRISFTHSSPPLPPHQPPNSHADSTLAPVNAVPRHPGTRLVGVLHRQHVSPTLLLLLSQEGTNIHSRWKTKKG